MIVLALTLVLMLVVPAEAGSTRELGREHGEGFANQHWGPGCESAEKQCRAIARLSGYQVTLADHVRPFLVKHRGWIVAFTLKVGKPTASQTNLFENQFGKPSARLSVLKPPPKNKRERGHFVLELVGQTRRYDLTKHFGKKVRFKLSKPLVIPAESTVAVTAPTWAPVFASSAHADSGKNYEWRASQQKGQCGNAALQNAHQIVGNVSYYDCHYKGAQLDYSATFTTRRPKGSG